MKAYLGLLCLFGLASLAVGKMGNPCIGEGRASCDQGELCRDGFCTVVYLKPWGCEESKQCPQDYKCHDRLCILYMTDDDRRNMNKQRMQIKMKMEEEEKKKKKEL